MDIFAPPQKPEFLAGISNNIPAEVSSNNGCGCGCGTSNNGCNCGCGTSNNGCGCN